MNLKPTHHTQMLVNLMMKFEYDINMLAEIVKTKAFKT
jgi:hypothetical protein